MQAHGWLVLYPRSLREALQRAPRPRQCDDEHRRPDMDGSGATRVYKDYLPMYRTCRCPATPPWPTSSSCRVNPRYMSYGRRVEVGNAKGRIVSAKCPGFLHVSRLQECGLCVKPETRPVFHTPCPQYTSTPARSLTEAWTCVSDFLSTPRRLPPSSSAHSRPDPARPTSPTSDCATAKTSTR